MAITLVGTAAGLTIAASLYKAFRIAKRTTAQAPTPGDIQIQTSKRGQPIPIIYGNRKIAGNLIWYGNFQVIRHEQKQEGGKGGGGSSTSVNYTYTVSFAFGICMGYADICRVWKGKEEIDLSNFRVYQGHQLSPDAHVALFTDRAPVWKNLCYIVAEDFDLGDSPFFPQLTFEIGRPEGYFLGGDVTVLCAGDSTLTLEETGSGCSKSYSISASAESHFPIEVSKRTTTLSCLGEVVGPWLSQGELSSSDDSIDLGSASFCLQEVKGVDGCGNPPNITSDNFSISCDECSGGDTLSGADSISSCGDSEQYSWNGPANPSWSVSGNVGSGGGIDSNGILTTGPGCCGTVNVCASLGCCTVSKEVRMPGGFWDLICGPATTCDAFNGCGVRGCCSSSCTNISGDIMTVYSIVCGTTGSSPHDNCGVSGCIDASTLDCTTGGPCDGTQTGCNDNAPGFVSSVTKYQWVCP